MSPRLAKLPKVLALGALLLAGCAQPAPLIPQPPAPPPVAAVAPKAEEPGPASRPAAPGEVRLVGERKEKACGACWSFPEILSAATAAVLFGWALFRLYRRRSGKA